MARFYRTDISTLRPVERRSDGTILVDAHLSRCGVFQYYQKDGTIRRELRLPEDVFDQASLDSFEGRPVTNNHPPGMIDARNAREYAVGSLLGVPKPDGDHMLGRLSVYDHSAVGDMEGGKIQVSNGYTCDCIEAPGVHPLYGAYDAIQKNIRGNHVAIVDRARAGITASARMDADCENGMMVLAPGDQVTVDSAPRSCKSHAMANHAPAARIEVVVKHDAGEPSATEKIDPDDLASRNAAGKTAAKKAAKEQPGECYEDAGGDAAKVRKPAPDPDDEDDEDDEDDDDDEGEGGDEGSMDAADRPRDAYDESLDDDGELTQAARDKIKASNFAVPDKEKLPIHDKAHVRAAMSRFGQTDFEDADEKHAAFNRIKSKAGQYGISTEGFEKAHSGNLDRADGAKKDNAMSTIDTKALQEKADKRKEKLVVARTKIDSLETEKKELQTKLDAAEATIENMKRESKAPGAAEKTDADDVQTRVDAKVELLDQARKTGADVNSKMDDMTIMRATIKHVDGEDVEAGKSADYVRALYDGALKRAKKDASDTAKGDAALAAARAATIAAGGSAHLDGDTDEEAAKAGLRAASRTMIQQPSIGRRNAGRN